MKKLIKYFLIFNLVVIGVVLAANAADKLIGVKAQQSLKSWFYSRGEERVPNGNIANNKGTCIYVLICTFGLLFIEAKTNSVN